MNNLPETLSQIANAASALKTVGGPVGIVGGIAQAAFKTAALFAQDGKDPVVEIEHILRADPKVQDVHNRWSDKLDAKFGRNKP